MSLSIIYPNSTRIEFLYKSITYTIKSLLAFKLRHSFKDFSENVGAENHEVQVLQKCFIQVEAWGNLLKEYWVYDCL
jgi:hypothetical protein